MTAQVIAVDFGERRIPNGEYRCCILAAESDGQRIEWRMQAIDGPCHELRFSTATDDRDGELAELLEALGMEVRSSKGKVDLGELVGREVNHLRGRWMVRILQVVGEGASIRMASRLIAPGFAARIGCENEDDLLMSRKKSASNAVKDSADI